MRTRLAIALSGVALVGCREASSARRESRAELTGHASYLDARTDLAGERRDPDLPGDVRGTVRMTVTGTGTIEGSCLDAGSDLFVAYYEGDLTIDASGAIRVPLYPLTPAIYTPSGCAIDELAVRGVTSVSIDAAFRTTPQRCAAMCTASARARAEVKCRTARCRRAFEVSAARDCDATCESQATAIGARSTLDQDLLDVDAEELGDGNFGGISTTLIFDHLCDDRFAALR